MLSRTRANHVGLLPLAALGTALLTAVAWGADGLVQDRRLDHPQVALAAENATTVSFEVPVNEPVLRALEQYAGTARGRRFMQDGLEAKERHDDMVSDALERYGLPRQLAAIPVVESGYRNLGAVEGESAAPPGPMGAGLWMFIPQTARAYGMRVDDEHDDRLDVVVETDAAMRLLRDLHAEFGDWPLALAGYNQGSRRVRGAIREHGTRDAWELIELGGLNDYAARIAAAAIVIEDPSLAGAD